MSNGRVLSCKRAGDTESRMQSGTEISLDFCIAGNRTDVSSDISLFSISNTAFLRHSCVGLVTQPR